MSAKELTKLKITDLWKEYNILVIFGKRRKKRSKIEEEVYRRSA